MSEKIRLGFAPFCRWPCRLAVSLGSGRWRLGLFWFRCQNISLWLCFGSGLLLGSGKLIALLSSLSGLETGCFWWAWGLRGARFGAEEGEWCWRRRPRVGGSCGNTEGSGGARGGRARRQSCGQMTGSERSWGLGMDHPQYLHLLASLLVLPGSHLLFLASGLVAEGLSNGFCLS